jgi:cation transport regulator ChaB
MNLVLSLLLSKVIVPSEFHEQSVIVDMMLASDTSGLIDSLTQFQTDCATVDLTIDTESDKLDEIINEEWLPNINSEYRGRGIEVGIKGLMKEYYQERWRGATFPVLKILKWDKIEGIYLPVSMTFVNGGSVYAEDKDNQNEIDLFGYDYFLGKVEKEKIEGEAYFMYKPFVRWFAKYPVPFLIKRGIYKNWKLIDMIKNKEIELVDRIIPYMMLVLKGTEQLTLNNITYDEPTLKDIKVKIQEMLNKLSQVSLTENNEMAGKTPTRVTNFDEEIKHLIPDLESMFKRELFVQAEKNILAGLGFIDIAEPVSSSRRESVLNPKIFIKECNTGLNDFKTILRDILSLVKEKNEESRKYNAKKWIIASNPITDFTAQDFKELMRSLSDRGLISNSTVIAICGDNTVNYELERRIREKEIKQGDEYSMYPKVIQNQEEKGIDISGEQKNNIQKEEKVPEDRKKGTPESKNWNQAMLDEEELIEDELVFSEAEDLELAKWKKERVTDQYIRKGQINPDKFQKDYFRTIWISESRGIKAIIGRLIGKETTTIQSYLFIKDKWDNQKVKEWFDSKDKETENSELIGAPYSEIADLPPAVRKKLDLSAQRRWMSIWNNAYKFYLKKLGDSKKAETMAFKVAWSKARNIENAELLKSTLEEVNEDKIAQELLDIELKTKKLSLLDRLLGRKNEDI